jgi:NADPH-dependent curcumin reductase CurA
MNDVNRQLLVKQWPQGLPQPEDFEVVDGPMPVLNDAEVLIRNKYLSIDPYYRHALGPHFLGTRFRHPGDVIMAVTMGEVVESRDPMVPVGSHVTTLLGDMQDYAAVSGRAVRVLSIEFFGDGALPLSTAPRDGILPSYLTGIITRIVQGHPRSRIGQLTPLNLAREPATTPP